MAKIQFDVDSMFDNWNFPDENKRFKNHLSILEQWFIDEFDYENTANGRREVAENPKSRNRQKLRKILNQKIQICRD
jgi:hypothetical protein